jgi:hypothetical protein
MKLTGGAELTGIRSATRRPTDSGCKGLLRKNQSDVVLAQIRHGEPPGQIPGAITSATRVFCRPPAWEGRVRGEHFSLDAAGRVAVFAFDSDPDLNLSHAQKLSDALTNGHPHLSRQWAIS